MGGVVPGCEDPALLPAVVGPPGKHVLDPLAGERCVIRKRASRGPGRGRDRRTKSPGVGQDDAVQVAVELPGNEALRKTQDALQVGKPGGHLLGEFELHAPCLVFRVETLPGEGVDEELGHPDRLGRGRSHRGQGFLRKYVPA